MGRKIVAEQAIERRFEASIKAREGVERGILIGHLAAARDHLYAVVPFPEDSENPGKPPSNDWALQHAAAVSKMLPGGAAVIGVFAFCDKAAFDALAKSHEQILRKLSPGRFDTGERLALHIDARTGKASCKSFEATGGSKPAEFRYAALLDKAVTFATTVNVDISVPVPTESKALSKTVLESIKTTEKALKGGAVMIRGSLDMPAPDTTTDKLQLVPQKSTGAAVVEVDLAAHWASAAPKPGSMAAQGCIRLRGCIRAQCIAPPSHMTWAGVAHELQLDVCHSLRERVQLLCDEMEDDEGLMATTVGVAEAWELPKRVFAPLLVAPGHDDAVVQVCEYMMPGEALDECEERFKSMLGLSAPGEDPAQWIVSAEAFPGLAAKASQSSGKPPSKSASSGASKSEQPAASSDGSSKAPVERGGLPIGLLVGGAVAALAGVGLFMANQ